MVSYGNSFLKTSALPFLSNTLVALLMHQSLVWQPLHTKKFVRITMATQSLRLAGERVVLMEFTASEWTDNFEMQWQSFADTCADPWRAHFHLSDEEWTICCWNSFWKTERNMTKKREMTVKRSLARNYHWPGVYSTFARNMEVIWWLSSWQTCTHSQALPGKVTPEGTDTRTALLNYSNIAEWLLSLLH